MGFSRLTVTLSAYILVCLCSRSLPGESGPLKVDLDRGEIRVPCRFVNPTRVLEVFACHRRGPGHETVLLFDATGPQLVEALTEIGCRGSNFWNVTGPEDFEKTQGDRVLVSVSWIWKGERVEIPAEGILTDGDFGFPAFVRGFSFGVRNAKRAESLSSGDGKSVETGAEKSVPPAPEVVEITLGGTNRQKAVYPILWHPTTSSPMLPWVMEPMIDDRVVRDLSDLVEQEVSAELILRRITSEAKFVDQEAQRSRMNGLRERMSLYQSLRPFAVAIDARKQEIEKLVSELTQRLSEAESQRSLDSTLREVIESLHLKARALVEETSAAYLRMYDLQERFKLDWVRRQPKLNETSDIDPVSTAEFVAVLVEDGFGIEPLIAEKRVEIARRELTRVQSDDMLSRALFKDIEALLKRRDARVTAAQRRDFARVLTTVDEEQRLRREAYESDVRKYTILSAKFQAEQRVIESEAAEFRARHEGTWDTVGPSILKQRQVAKADGNVHSIEYRIHELDDDLRWAERDSESKLKDRREQAKRDVKKLTVVRKELTEKLEAAVAARNALKE
ncbi:MAG: hypothetical protein MK538_04060 [Planctomycetes bacterium]|nr:hypothetical protein [Planctomycetota bacterium]